MSNDPHGCDSRRTYETGMALVYMIEVGIVWGIVYLILKAWN